VSRRDGWACLLNSGYGSVMSRNLGSAGQLCDPHLGMEFNDGPRSHFRILLFQFCGVDVFLQILQKIEQFSNIVLQRRPCHDQPEGCLHRLQSSVSWLRRLSGASSTESPTSLMDLFCHWGEWCWRPFDEVATGSAAEDAATAGCPTAPSSSSLS
jgi:hypothetical protein